jgi:hypothetical protein
VRSCATEPDNPGHGAGRRVAGELEAAVLVVGGSGRRTPQGQVRGRLDGDLDYTIDTAVSELATRFNVST